MERDGEYMKTCKDCIHFEVCCYVDMFLPICDSFKDKSELIELPCSVGDYCIWHDDLWYINNITYCCDGSFILWMSMADKSPCGAEAVASEVEFISKEEVEKKLEALIYGN